MFSSALSLLIRPGVRARLLVEEAKALAGASYDEKALRALREAGHNQERIKIGNRHIFDEMGDLYLKLGRPREALSSFNRALEMQNSPKDTNSVRLKIAQCYRLLNRKEERIAIYDQLAGLDDPLWSALGKEALAEIDFEKEMEKAKRR